MKNKRNVYEVTIGYFESYNYDRITVIGKNAEDAIYNALKNYKSFNREDWEWREKGMWVASVNLITTLD